MRHIDDNRCDIWYIKLTYDWLLENVTESMGVIWWVIAAGIVVINSVFRRVGMFLFWLPQVHLFYRNLQETLQIVALLPLLKTKSTYNIAFKNISAVWAVGQDVRTDRQIVVNTIQPTFNELTMLRPHFAVICIDKFVFIVSSDVHTVDIFNGDKVNKLTLSVKFYRKPNKHVSMATVIQPMVGSKSLGYHTTILWGENHKV